MSMIGVLGGRTPSIFKLRPYQPKALIDFQQLNLNNSKAFTPKDRIMLARHPSYRRAVFDEADRDLSQREGDTTAFAKLCSRINQGKGQAEVNLYIENTRLDDTTIGPLFSVGHFSILNLSGNPLSRDTIASVIKECRFDCLICTDSPSLSNDPGYFASLSKADRLSATTLIICARNNLKDALIPNAELLRRPDIMARVIFISGETNSVYALKAGESNHTILEDPDIKEYVASWLQTPPRAQTVFAQSGLSDPAYADFTQREASDSETSDNRV